MFTLPENVRGHGRTRAFGTIWYGKSWTTRRESGILGQSCQKSIEAVFRLARYFGKKIDCPTDAEQPTENYAL